MSRKGRRKRYPPRDTQFKEALFRNNDTYNNYFNLLLNIALSQFEYKNAPMSLNLRMLEKYLFFKGAAVIFKDENITPELSPYTDGSNIFCCQLGASAQRLDIYGEPVEYDGISKNSNYRIRLNNKNSVIIYNDKSHTSFLNDINEFCLRLYNIDRIIDININGQKEPVVFQGSKNQILTLKNLWLKYDGNEPVVIIDDGLDLGNAIKSLQSKVEFKADKLYQIKKDIWNECLTYIGVANVNINKSTQLISDEVLRSMGGAIAARYSRTDERKIGVEKINKIFGTEIKVEFRDTTDNFHAGTDAAAPDNFINLLQGGVNDG